jgi:Cof subfamily protein (haloacid dehalogenase superfamily)
MIEVGSKQKQILKNLKHIVTDIDGTLLNDNGELGIESKKLLKALMYSGVVVSFATGRSYSAVTEIAEELSLNGYIISLDGALIKKYTTGETVCESYLREAQVKKAIRLCEQNLVNIVLCHASEIYYTENNSVIPSLLSKYGASYKQVESYNNYVTCTLEIVCSSDIKESIKRLEEKFNFPYTIGCNTSYFRSKKNENIFYLEIRKSGSSKGKAVNRILKMSSITAKQTAVIGDWYNDITMFDTNAYKVAVANAIPELINNADFVTAQTNREDGTAEFFELVLKSKKD